MSMAPRSTQLPLSGHELLHTSDAVEARHVVAEAFCPHDLMLLDHARGFDTRFHAVHIGGLDLCYLSYGGRVHISPSEQEDFYLVLIPLDDGKAQLRNGRDEVEYDRAGAGIPPHDRAYHIDVWPDSPHLVLRIPRTRVEEHLRSVLAHQVVRPIRFDMKMDLTSLATRSWYNTLRHCVSEADGNGLVLTQPLVAQQMESVLLTGLLMSQPNNYSPELHGLARNAPPRLVCQAIDLVEAHAPFRIPIEEIADRLDVSIRTLQDNFRRHMDTNLQAYQLEVCFRAVREALLTADPRVKVATVVAQCGFQPNGTFSGEYRKRFGESPSETLRR